MEGYEVIFARYSSDGRLLTTRNITNTSSLVMGYIDVNQEGSTLRFSMQRTFADSVTIYEVAANATQESDVTRVFTDELEAQLLDLCPDTHPCTQASFFSADFAPDGTMAFAFRLWDRAGHAIGNQAVGLLGVDRRVRSLTFDPTRPGTNSTNSVETCPRFHPKDATKLLLAQIRVRQYQPSRIRPPHEYHLASRHAEWHLRRPAILSRALEGWQFALY
jgi:hypothetical protein